MDKTNAQLRLDAQQSWRNQAELQPSQMPACGTRQTAQPTPSNVQILSDFEILQLASKWQCDPDHAFILIPASIWPNHVIYHVCRIKAVAGYVLPHLLHTCPTRVSSHVFVRHVSISQRCLHVCVPIKADTRVFVIGSVEFFLVLILCLSSFAQMRAEEPFSTTVPTLDIITDNERDLHILDTKKPTSVA